MRLDFYVLSLLERTFFDFELPNLLLPLFLRSEYALELPCKQRKDYVQLIGRRIYELSPSQNLQPKTKT